MRSLRIGLFVLCLLPGLSFAQKREFVELQRDVAALQDQVRSLANSNSENMGRVTALLQQALDSINKLNTNVALLDAAMRDRDKTIVAPVTSVGAKVDQMSSEFQAMRVTMDDMSSRLGKLQQNLVDLNNTIKVIQAPPALPSGGPGGGPGSAAGSAPPADTLYSSAMRDKNGGNDDVALQEFNDYLKFYGNTEMAPNAQYYIGEILYNRKDYQNALQAFDTVLERYPDNNKTLDAMYMKGRTLVQLGERSAGADVFRAVYNKAPRSELAAKAKAQLASMGLSVNTPAAKRATPKKQR
jgi:tol-pal system protein YbgF